MDARASSAAALLFRASSYAAATMSAGEWTTAGGKSDAAGGSATAAVNCSGFASAWFTVASIASVFAEAFKAFGLRPRSALHRSVDASTSSTPRMASVSIPAAAAGSHCTRSSVSSPS